MIKSIEVKNSYGETLTMALRNPEVSGYVITNISGLGPVQVDIKQTQLVSGLKYKYNKGFFKAREIKIDFIYYENNIANKNVEELRYNLYTYFKTNSLTKIYIEKDDGNIYCIEGYPDKHDPTYFSNSCGCQVSIICPDPWFRKNDTEYMSSVTSETETDVGPSYNNKATVVYTGNIDAGFILETHTDIRNLAGKTLLLDCVSQIDGKSRTLELTIPENYPSQLSPASLFIDFTDDCLKVYGGHDSSLGYGAFGVAVDYRTPYDWYTTATTGEIVDINGNSYDIFTNTNPVYGPTDIAESFEHPRSMYMFGEYDEIDQMFVPTSISDLPEKITVKAIACSDYNKGYAGIDNETIEENGQLYDIYPLYDKDYKACNLVIYIEDGITELWIKNNDGSGNNGTCIQFGILKSDKTADPTIKIDGIGWVEASSITQRGELPRLLTGNNNITLNTKDKDIAIEYVIKNNTLYRGL